MKKLTTLTIAAATLALSAGSMAAGAASAQGRWHNNGQWQNINQRQAQLDRQIDRGVRTGQLDRREAARARAEFKNIARLEARYRSNGLNPRERADLDQRFDRLAARVHWDRNDRQYGYGYGR